MGAVGRVQGVELVQGALDRLRPPRAAPEVRYKSGVGSVYTPVNRYSRKGRQMNPSDQAVVSSAPASLPLSELFLSELREAGILQERQQVEACRREAEAARTRGRIGTSEAVPDYWLAKPPRDLFGIALSGGGIRSATFNLGLLQGLAESKLLRHFDYLSTVSGGGYIGSFWSRWRSRPGPSTGVLPEDVAFPAVEQPGGEDRAIRHLREFSNFLSPRLGLFNLETGNIASVLVASIVPSLLASLCFLLLALYAWAACAWALFSSPPLASLAGLLLALFGIQVFFEGTWRRCSQAEQRSGGVYAIALLFVLAAAGLAWWYWFLAHGRVLGWAWIPVPLPRAGWIPLGLGGWRGFANFLAASPYLLGGRLFAPAGAAAAGAATLVLGRWVFSRRWTTFVRRSRRGAVDRALSRSLFALAAWLVASAIWMAAAWLVARYEGLGGLSVFGLAGASGGLFSWARKLLSEQPSRPQVGGFTERLKPLIPQVLAYVTVALLLVGCAAAMIYCASAWGQSPAARLAPLLVAAVATALTLVFFNPNEVGFHAFYRARLSRAYLGASNPAWAASGNRLAGDAEQDDCSIEALPAGRPFHLVCCTANDLSGDHLANLHRGARSAVLSRVGYSVGEDWTGWQGGDWEPPTLGSAITASGAAFNSHMGSKSMTWGPAVTFLMAAFNLRLGLWLPHPLHWTNPRRPSRFLIGLPFYKELLSISQAGTHASHAAPGDPSPIAPCAQGSDVHLSDGGHFENMALYELIRRHCRYILVADCGADPDIAFDDLGNAVRRIREDFGVEIDIDLRPLRPGANGFAEQPMVAGDIRYPTGDTGVLLFFKPTLVGNEPADILQYKRRNGAFPHETTGDQFYDEAQWESYRRLGRHAARSAFRFLQSAVVSGAEVFTRARFEWFPVPPAARESFPRLAARVSELEARLRDERCSRLLREVYKEIDELDRQAKLEPVAPAPSGDGARASAAERAADLSGEELAASLQVLRLGILFMEEVFFEADLETNADHRVNLGWLNYFARWVYAPLFRMWWPLLKSMYHARFARFLEARFDLPHLQDSTPGVEEVETWAEWVGHEGRGGFAWECWKRRFADREALSRRMAGKVLHQYRLKMSYEGREDPYDIQAALVPLRATDCMAAWEAEDFFVPPGLWGIGIGEDFLGKLAALLRDRTLVVRLPSAAPGSPIMLGQGATAGAGMSEPVRRRERTTDSQLYRCAGFREAWYDEAHEQLRDPITDRLLDADLGALFTVQGRGLTPEEARSSCWLIRPPFGPSAPPR